MDSQSGAAPLSGKVDAPAFVPAGSSPAGPSSLAALGAKPFVPQGAMARSSSAVSLSVGAVNAPAFVPGAPAVAAAAAALARTCRGRAQGPTDARRLLPRNCRRSRGAAGQGTRRGRQAVCSGGQAARCTATLAGGADSRR
jgi:hypothetical protein